MSSGTEAHKAGQTNVGDMNVCTFMYVCMYVIMYVCMCVCMFLSRMLGEFVPNACTVNVHLWNDSQPHCVLTG